MSTGQWAGGTGRYLLGQNAQICTPRWHLSVSTSAKKHILEVPKKGAILRCFLFGWCSSNLWIRTKWLSMNCRLSQSQRSPGGLGQKSLGQQQAARLKKTVRSLSNPNLTFISLSPNGISLSLSQWMIFKSARFKDFQISRLWPSTPPPGRQTAPGALVLPLCLTLSSPLCSN